MAEVVAVELQVDSGKSVQEAEKLEKALIDIKKNTNINNVEAQFKKLNLSIEQGGGSVEDLQRAIKSYQTIALTAGRESPVGKDAIKRASDLRDRLVDLNNEVNRNANDGKNMQAALQLGTSITAGYQAFAGLTALVGEENEELLQTLTKLQATQSALQGIEQIRINLEKESFLMIKAKNVQQKVMNGLMVAYNAIVGTSTGALKLFRLALIATGLGALVVLLGTLISKWNDWKDAIFGTSQAQKTLNSVMKEANKARAEEESQLRQLVDIAKDKTQTDKDRQKAIDVLNERYGSLNEQLTLENINTQKGTQLIDKYIEAIDRKSKAQAFAEKQTELYKKKIEEEMKSTEELVDFYDKSEADLKSTSFTQLIGLGKTEGAKKEYEKELDEIAEINRKKNKETIDNQIEALKKYVENDKDLKKELTKASLEGYEKEEKALGTSLDARIKKQEEYQNKLKELQQSFEDLTIANVEDEDQRRLMELETKHQREMDALREQYGEKTELIKQLEENQHLERNELLKELREKDRVEMEVYDANKEEKDQIRRERVIEKEKNLYNIFSQLNENYKEDKEKIDKAIAESKQGLYNATQSAVSGLVEMVGTQTKAGKALAVSQIAIDTAVGFMQGLRLAQDTAKGTGPAAPFIFATYFASQVSAVLSAANRAKSILKAGVNISPPSISGVNSGGSSQTITANQTNNDQRDERTDFTKPLQPIIVESEVHAVRKRQDQIMEFTTI